MLQASQIVTLVGQITKAPGMTSQIGQCLNTVLVSLALQQDLDLVKRQATIILNTGSSPTTFALPANYLRARKFWYPVNAAIFTMDPVSLEKLRTQYNDSSVVDYPYWFATDTNTANNLGYVYPNPVVTLTATMIYFDTAVEIVTPETSSTVPWYPDEDYLINETARRMMRITDDLRQAQFKVDSDETQRRTLRLLNDPEGRAVCVRRDPSTFRNSQNVKPTKVEGGW